MRRPNKRKNWGVVKKVTGVGWVEGEGYRPPAQKAFSNSPSASGRAKLIGSLHLACQNRVKYASYLVRQIQW